MCGSPQDNRIWSFPLSRLEALAASERRQEIGTRLSADQAHKVTGASLQAAKGRGVYTWTAVILNRRRLLRRSRISLAENCTSGTTYYCLIDSSWGDTVAEAWVSEDSLKSFPEFQTSIESLKRIDEKSAISRL